MNLRERPPTCWRCKNEFFTSLVCRTAMLNERAVQHRINLNMSPTGVTPLSLQYSCVDFRKIWALHVKTISWSNVNIITSHPLVYVPLRGILKVSYRIGRVWRYLNGTTTMEPHRMVCTRTPHSDNAMERLRATERGLAVIYQVRTVVRTASFVCNQYTQLTVCASLCVLSNGLMHACTWSFGLTKAVLVYRRSERRWN